LSLSPEDNVKGVGIGPRLATPSAGNELCVRLYVEQQLPADMRSQRWALPTEIGGMPVEVIEAGRFHAYSDAPHRQLMRPAQPGCSIGVRSEVEDDVVVGTIGAIVNVRGAPHILGNNHVLAGENRFVLGTEILQPGLLDYAEAEPIARLSNFEPLRSDTPNMMDCAIAEVLEPNDVNPTFLPGVGPLAGSASAQVLQDLQVEKTGRSTGHTTGRIVDMNFDGQVEYETGTFVFRNQLLVEGDRAGRLHRLLNRPWTEFSEHGDSGAVVVDRQHKLAVGLLFAGSRNFSIVTPIDRILGAFGAVIAI